MYVLIPLTAGFALDLLLGDPLTAQHPVVWIGRLISRVEKWLYREGSTGVRAGAWTVLLVCAGSVAVPVLALLVARGIGGLVSPRVGRAAVTVLASLLCWQMLAARGLWTASDKVRAALERGDREGARQAVSMIVGRDTASLDEAGIIRAAVETVAENTSDGVVAPIFWMALLGIPGLFLYKAVNTMDSMIGYKNARYFYYGKPAARLDDVLNFLPARLSGLLMTLAAALLPGLDGRAARRIYRRDRRLSSSPNAGCTEAAAAGALGIRLLGPAVYFGVRQDKPYIGDDTRPAEPEDIRRAGKLMLLTSLLALAAVWLMASIVLWALPNSL